MGRLRRRNLKPVKVSEVGVAFLARQRPSSPTLVLITCRPARRPPEKRTSPPRCVILMCDAALVSGSNDFDSRGIARYHCQLGGSDHQGRRTGRADGVHFPAGFAERIWRGRQLHAHVVRLRPRRRIAQSTRRQPAAIPGHVENCLQPGHLVRQGEDQRAPGVQPPRWLSH